MFKGLKYNTFKYWLDHGLDVAREAEMSGTPITSAFDPFEDARTLNAGGVSPVPVAILAEVHELIMGIIVSGLECNSTVLRPIIKAFVTQLPGGAAFMESAIGVFAFSRE